MAASNTDSLFDTGHELEHRFQHVHMTIDKQGASEPIIIVQQPWR